MTQITQQTNTETAEGAAHEQRMSGLRYNSDVGYFERDMVFYDSDGYALDDQIQSELNDMVYRSQSGDYEDVN